MYIYIYVYIYMYTYIYKYTYIYIYKCIYINIHICKHYFATSQRVCVFACVRCCVCERESVQEDSLCATERILLHSCEGCNTLMSTI